MISGKFWKNFITLIKDFQSNKKDILNTDDLYAVPKPKIDTICQFPIISIIIPCFNEEKFLPKCLDSLLDQTYEKNKIEILIVDGMSNDGTFDIIEKYTQKYVCIKKLDNKNRFTPYAMNIGIQNSIGEFVIKADAHTIYDKNYIKNCIRYIKEYEVDNIGGILKTVSADDKLISRAIISSLSSFFGVGNSYFRIGSLKPRWVDTVAFGCYHKQMFNSIGMYDEKLVRGQDIELNMRLKKAGGKILLHPDIVGYYYPPSTLKGFMRQSFINGLWAILPFRYTKVLPVSFRHLVPLIFIILILCLGFLGIFSNVGATGFFLLLGLYMSVDIFFSIRIAHMEKKIIMTWPLSIVFSILHFGYGIGSLIGVLRCIPSRIFWQNVGTIFLKER
jgi:glycosyltransferase involved in cell wall biosynthesis